MTTSNEPISITLTGGGTWDLAYDFRKDGNPAGTPSDFAPKVVRLVNEGAATVYWFDEAKHTAGAGSTVAEGEDPDDWKGGTANGIPIPAGDSVEIVNAAGFRRGWLKSATADVVVGGGAVV